MSHAGAAFLPRPRPSSEPQEIRSRIEPDPGGPGWAEPRLTVATPRPPLPSASAAEGVCDALPLPGRAGLPLRKGGEALPPGDVAPLPAPGLPRGHFRSGSPLTLRDGSNAVSGNRGRPRLAAVTPPPPSPSLSLGVTSTRPAGGRTGIPAAPGGPVAFSVTSQPAIRTRSGPRRRLHKTLVAPIDPLIPCGSRLHGRADRDVTAGDEDPLRRTAAAARFPEVSGDGARSRDAPRSPLTSPRAYDVTGSATESREPDRVLSAAAPGSSSPPPPRTLKASHCP
uniref:uncharacterized protein LOC117695869 n=1 Tax=Arvicanthis niloticus TaxID=61156 RepID=UPI00402B95CD